MVIRKTVKRDCVCDIPIFADQTIISLTLPSDLYGTDIPFLCFLTNMYLTSRFFALLETYKQETDPDVTLENAVFRVWFSFGITFRPVLSVVHVKDAGLQLEKRIERKPNSESDDSESRRKSITVVRVASTLRLLLFSTRKSGLEAVRSQDPVLRSLWMSTTR